MGDGQGNGLVEQIERTVEVGADGGAEFRNTVDVERFFPGWRINRLLGQGSYGAVYEIAQEQVDGMRAPLKSALKVLSIPRMKSEVEALEAMNMGDASIAEYFDKTARSVVAEVDTMRQLKSCPGIVAVEDFRSLKQEDGPGRVVLIKMELLESLPAYRKRMGGALSAQEAVRICIHIAEALQVCHEAGIIHRDVKPENIFRTQHGEYKLGDFGIARSIVERTKTAAPLGTPAFMAPEAMGGACGKGADVYALGMVLFRLLNDNRGPFYPQVPCEISQADIAAAESRRLGGARLPDPAHADGYLGDVVRSACNASPDHRFKSARAFQSALERWPGLR